jgi:hypothetical protein
MKCQGQKNSTGYSRMVGSLLRLSVVVLPVYLGLLFLTGVGFRLFPADSFPRKTRVIWSSWVSYRTEPPDNERKWCESNSRASFEKCPESMRSCWRFHRHQRSLPIVRQLGLDRTEIRKSEISYGPQIDRLSIPNRLIDRHKQWMTKGWHRTCSIWSHQHKIAASNRPTLHYERLLYERNRSPGEPRPSFFC